MDSIFKKTLGNGVRVLVEPVDYVKSASIGLWCRTGSHHKQENEGGVTHLIEHMLFKGTSSRTSKEIAEAIEGRGGALNAFTDREATCYYCRVLSDDIENGIDVLSDMLKNSLIDPAELDREKDVVLEEIKRSEDEPSDLVHDIHTQKRWGNHPLGRPILGTPESVSSFQRDHLVEYIDRRYRGQNILLSVAGHADPEQVVAWAEDRLGGLHEVAADATHTAPAVTVSETYVEKDVEQVHFCIGTDGVSLYDEDIYGMNLLDAILGGSMSSRLFQEVREKRGLVYSIGSYSSTYTVAGAYTVYGGTSPAKWPEVQKIVADEFAKIREEGVGEAELEKTKRHLSGNLVLAIEGMSSRMMRMSRNELNHQRVIAIDETLAKLNAVTPEKIKELANRFLNPSHVSITAIGPKN